MSMADPHFRCFEHLVGRSISIARQIFHGNRNEIYQLASISAYVSGPGGFYGPVAGVELQDRMVAAVQHCRMRPKTSQSEFLLTRKLVRQAITRIHVNDQ